MSSILGRHLLLIIVILGLLACEQTPANYAQAQHQATERLAAAYGQVSEPSAAPIIQYDQGFFVPPIEDYRPPLTSWSEHWVEFQLAGQGVRQALTDLLMPYHVSVRLLDDIDPLTPLSMNFAGTVEQALQQIALLTGFAIDSSERLLSVRRFEMAEFDVAFMAGATNFFLGEDARASRGQPGQMFGTVINNESPQYLNFTSESLSVWDDLRAAIQVLLSSDGTMVINQSSTSVLVKDYPQHVEQIRAYLLQQNQRLTRQVAVDVQVIDVTFNDRQQAGIDWDLVYQSSAAGQVVNFASQMLSPIQPGSPASALSVSQQSGRLAGSQAIIRALSQQGVVEVSSHPRIVSLNNQIAKIVLEDNATYLASAGTNATANVGSSDILIPGVVTTGFELYVLPKVANAQVVMQLSTSLSDLVAIDQISSGDNTIQTPHTNRKKFFMKAMVADGETLLISGLKNSKRQWREQRGFASWLLGGQREAYHQHSETVLLLTPRILPAAAVL
ncbi:hypothetical protein [Aliidiomarina maris]|uniref:Type IVB pilus formation R64 PilN family outer membrane protein n=1 Tax=Aliidiomarina maris TaxID=531312 RepID=A0A327WWN2_9GAMM|nr:hypothetical protein [Aliidiomarina maris]MBA3988306.1 hypothetical protein [Idiomarina sp.]RAJ96890.1 type IVB pilus formation R64 PilN family outer membrane protein [Aliidiomarina maris]RUO24172.1 hypothetical protein CWE07_08755 [Aliidiomarina maris]